MNIRVKIDEVVKKITSDKNLLKKFEKDPVSAIESMIGIDLPNDQVEMLIDAVKTKITAEKVEDALGALGGLFGKK